MTKMESMHPDRKRPTPGIRIVNLKELPESQVDEIGNLFRHAGDYSQGKTEEELRMMAAHSLLGIRNIRKKERRGFGFVAVDSETKRVVGLGQAMPLTDKFSQGSPLVEAVRNYASPKVAVFLYNHVVHPDWRGRGIGREIHQARILKAVEQGYTHVVHLVLPANNRRKSLIPKDAKCLGEFDFNGRKHEAYLQRIE